MSDDNLTCNAPQHCDLNNAKEDLNVDAYFDALEFGADRELEHKETVVEEDETSDSEEDNAQFFSPLDKTPAGYSNSAKLGLNKLRRSLSMCSIYNTNEDEKQDVAGAVIPTLELKQASSQQHLNRLAEPRRCKSVKNLSQNAFVSMAEATFKFHHGTPKRLKSQSKLCKVSLIPLTIPRSPKLAKQGRNRPNTALSKEEQKKIELEDVKKFKFRANPVNKKILREPFKIQPVEKKTTVLQPFHITEVKKKVGAEASAQPAFQAKPSVPKTLHNPRRIKSLPTATAKTVEPPNVPFKPIITQPVPFSFEKRDLELKKKKEEYIINKKLEDEKKARKFQASALSKKILQSRNEEAERQKREQEKLKEQQDMSSENQQSAKPNQSKSSSM